MSSLKPILDAVDAKHRSWVAEKIDERVTQMLVTSPRGFCGLSANAFAEGFKEAERQFGRERAINGLVKTLKGEVCGQTELRLSGVKIIVPATISGTMHLKRISETHLLRAQQTLAILYPQTFTPSFVDTRPIRDVVEPEAREAGDVVRMLQLVTGGHGQLELLSWSPLPETAISISPTSRGPSIDVRTVYGTTPALWPTLDESNTAEFEKLLTEWEAVPKPMRHKLRVAIDRWRLSVVRHSNVNRAIELGVAMDAFYRHDQANPVGQTIKQRFEAHGPPDSKLAETVGRLYDLRNSAMHDGRIDLRPNETDDDVRKLLEVGSARVQLGLRESIKTRRMPQ